MGSGLLTSVAVAGVYVIHGITNRTISAKSLTMLVLLVVIAITGFTLIPKIPNYNIYRAQNISELSNALGYILSWPISEQQFPALLLWSPAVITIPVLIYQRKLSRADLLLTGCFIWSFYQSIAIAYGRGQELTEVASRYTELFSLGLTSCAWFAIRAIEEFPHYPFRWVFIIFFAVFFYGHINRISNGFERYPQEPQAFLNSNSECLRLSENQQQKIHSKNRISNPLPRLRTIA